MRCDVNISVRPEGSEEFGVRTEIKNMSSFESIAKAIKYESQRHIDAIEFETEELVQETRRYDDLTGKTSAMRNKETEADYRYFPDANLMPIIIDDEWLEEIKANKPAEVDEKAEDYRLAGFSEEEIEMLISNNKIAKLLDDIVAKGCNAKEGAAWILTDCAGILRKMGKTLNDLTITADDLLAITNMVEKGDVNRSAGRKILIAVIEDGADPIAFCKENGLDKKFDESAIAAVIDQAIASNPQAVEDFKNGKTKALQALFGFCMKQLKGAGDPAVIKTMLEEKLK